MINRAESVIENSAVKRQGARSSIPILAVTLLTILSALGQFATSVYLPSLPAISRSLQASGAAVQLTLTAFLVAFAIGQLFFGPLSDRFGRRNVLLSGLTIYIVASVGCAYAPTVEFLIGARFFQAVGACAGLVIARAIVRDMFSGVQLLKIMAYITIAFATVPGLAPMLGGVLQDQVGWRATFMVTAGFGAIVFVLTWLRLEETLTRRVARLNLGYLLQSYSMMIRSHRFRRYTLATALALGATFAFLAGAPVVFIDTLGISPTEYGIYPSINVTGYMVGGYFTSRLAGSWSEAKAFALGLGVLLCGGFAMLALPLAGVVSVMGYMAPMFVFVTGLGMILPIGVAEAIRDFADRAGTAAAVLGFVQMGAAAGATFLIAYVPTADTISFPIVTASFAVLACCVFMLMAPAAVEE